MSNPYLYAARHPLAITVLVLAIIGGLFIYLWLLPLGLLAYGAMIVTGARDPELIASSQRPSRPRLGSNVFRAQLKAIERTQSEIERTVARTEGPLAALLSRIRDQTRELVEQAYTLADRGQLIEAYLKQLKAESLTDRISAIDIQISSTTDPFTVQQLRETRETLLAKQRNADDLQTYIGRINAQLQNIHANLDNTLAEIVRLRTADVVSASPITSQVAQRLSDLKTDMDTFQRILDTAVATATP